MKRALSAIAAALAITCFCSSFLTLPDLRASVGLLIAGIVLALASLSLQPK